MDYLVIVILVFLVAAGLAAVIWLKLFRSQQVCGTEEGKTQDSSRPTIQQKLSAPTASNFTPDQQSDTGIAGLGPIPLLPPKINPSHRPAPPDKEDTTLLSPLDAPIAVAIEGASHAPTLPEAETGSVAPGPATMADGGIDAPDSTASSECEQAPEAAHVPEHAGEAGITAHDVVPERVREPELGGHPQAPSAVAGTHDSCAKTECEIGESQTADVHDEADVTAIPQAVSMAQQEKQGHGPPVADTLVGESGSNGLVEPRTAELAEFPESPDGLRKPRVYRPTPRTPSQADNPRPTNGSSKTSRSRAMRVEVRVLFERGGFCRVTLLPQRDSSFPPEIDVKGDGNPPTLLALQDEWFQDVSIDDLGELLERGLVWHGTVKELGTVRWNLSGRDVFVLGRRNDLSGYITMPRLLLGEEHAVLCTETRLPSVLEALRAAGSPEPAILRADLGAPHGWAVLKGVTPKSPVASSGEGDILDSLRPLADVEIALLDGIRLSRTTWLAGYPPRIHVRGNADEIGDVLIDGRPAVCSADSTYEAEGWDATGTHDVWCPNASKTYTIQEGPEHWDAWEAYDWTLGEPTGIRSAVSATICGMLVFPHDEHARKRKAVTVPATNCVLIGSNPGEIHVCRARADLRASKQVVFPWFTPVWALPLDPLHCDKRVIRIISVNATKSAVPSSDLAARQRTRAVMAWCSAILDASRKGLVVEPPDDAVENHWREYRLVARAISRGRR